MTQDKPIKDRLNEFYRVAWALVDDLTLIDISTDDPVRSNIDGFVKAIIRSHEKVSTEGYAEAYEALEEASVGMIRLCKYKDQNLPNLDTGLSRECAKAYRALPDPTVIQNLDVKVNSSFVEKMKSSYQGKSEILGPSKPMGNLDSL